MILQILSEPNFPPKELRFLHFPFCPAFCHQTRQIRIEHISVFPPRLKNFKEPWTSSPPLSTSPGSDWQAARTERLFHSRGPKVKGFFHRRTSAPRGRQSRLVYAACTQRRAPHTDTVTRRRPASVTTRTLRRPSYTQLTKMPTYVVLEKKSYAL